MIDSEVETIGVMRSCADSTEQRARRTGDCHRSVAVADSFWASMGYAHCHPQGANYPMGLPAPEDALREVDEVKAMFEQANYRVHDVLDVEVKFLGRCWR